MILLVGVGCIGILTACVSNLESVETSEIRIQYDGSTKLPKYTNNKSQETWNVKTNDEESIKNENIGEPEEYSIVKKNDFGLDEEGIMREYTNEKDETLEQKDIIIKLSFNDEEIFVTLYDNPTSRDLLSVLPLSQKFEDYAGTEKISYLSRNLSTKDAPNGYEPSAGDLTLYAPWGNLAIFYKDFGYTTGLIPLGKIKSGVEKITEIQQASVVTIEKVDFNY